MTDDERCTLCGGIDGECPCSEDHSDYREWDWADER